MNEHSAEYQRFIPFFPVFSCPFFLEGLNSADYLKRKGIKGELRKHKETRR